MATACRLTNPCHSMLSRLDWTSFPRFSNSARPLIAVRYASVLSKTPLETPVSEPDPLFTLDINFGEASRSKRTFEMKTYKPVTPGIRHLRRPINPHLYQGRPIRALTVAKRKKGGRNRTGQICVRHHGGGHRQRIRMVDYFRNEPGPQVVLRIEYDPGRSGHIALIEHTQTKVLSYILAADDLRAGDIVQSYRAGIPDELLKEMGGFIDPGILAARTVIRGNCLPIKMIPIGTYIHNIGLKGRGPGKLCRSAGASAQILANAENVFATIRLQSHEVRKIPVEACATIGIVSNIDHQHTKLGKAGRSRWMGIRPTVRGVAMNACDHPHGGGRIVL
ncbi:54S ribosomal protein RML2, mitochondrial [Neolecta irregularis DAH-3]|uniref:Large ribosomal subunit protein uL2m n=1 Tax=Neolecta irregularis (strain DAH-3) TaxID=1198029 RepID=A0A1U7LVN6_NEOID|nr:54S ribosomal protein RML2, mitochondrial [Neolecta irregularis DAH-3]|eukprot:OLL26704.1 54S ribosomal protein RML2, mitochondrial [Neolecta irregularis DAH-3]